MSISFKSLKSSIDLQSNSYNEHSTTTISHFLNRPLHINSPNLRSHIASINDLPSTPPTILLNPPPLRPRRYHTLSPRFQPPSRSSEASTNGRSDARYGGHGRKMILLATYRTKTSDAKCGGWGREVFKDGVGF